MMNHCNKCNDILVIWKPLKSKVKSYCYVNFGYRLQEIKGILSKLIGTIGILTKTF